MKVHDILHNKEKKVNFLWILYGLVLVILFLVSSTDLIIKEETAKIYPISVVIGDVSDENYVNFRKGMERAAMEFNGDISFITLYEKGSAAQQKELMLREQEDGSRALIVAPVDAGMAAGMQQDNLLTVPVVFINTEKEKVEGLNNRAVLTFDYHAMGCRMGERILEEHPGEDKVYLLEGEKMNEVDMLFAQGVRDTLSVKGWTVFLIESAGENDWAQVLEEAVLIAPNPESLLRAAQFLVEDEQSKEKVKGLYGRGSTVPLLNYLDKGIIQGLCVTDDFSAGYLSVKTAVELAENRPVEEMGYLESYDIGREDLRNEKYEKILFPIE